MTCGETWVSEMASEMASERKKHLHNGVEPSVDPRERRVLRPRVLRGGADQLEDDVELVGFAHPLEEGLAVLQPLGEDAAKRPHVDCGAVALLTEENLWSAVPERSHVGSA